MLTKKKKTFDFEIVPETEFPPSRHLVGVAPISARGRANATGKIIKSVTAFTGLNEKNHALLTVRKRTRVVRLVFVLFPYSCTRNVRPEKFRIDRGFFFLSASNDHASRTVNFTHLFNNPNRNMFSTPIYFVRFIYEGFYFVRVYYSDTDEDLTNRRQDANIIVIYYVHDVRVGTDLLKERLLFIEKNK